MHRHSFSIYDASAGSGKTYALVKEYLKIILKANQHDAYRNILAITFTNKAVHEMKSRIVGSLSEFAKEEPGLKSQDLMRELAAETGLSVIQIKSKSQQIIKHIIHNYAAFDISTIDKFTHKVIRAFAYDLGLPVTFEVTLDTENLLIEAVDAIIAKAGVDETLTNLLIDFTMEKTDDDKSWDISREILETGRLILNENNRNEIVHFQDKSIGEFIEIKKRLKKVCNELENQSVDYARQALALIAAEGLEFNSFYSGYVPKHFFKLSNGEVIMHEGHYKYLEESEGKRYSAKTAQSDKESIDKIADTLLDILKKINAIAEKYAFYKAFLKNITPLSLLNTVSNELVKIQKEQNVLSIAEFNAIIHKEIQNQPAPFIYERLGERYRHFFIDEFQDTSEMQWQNLIPLIDNATSSEINGEKGTLMIVGDAKQSIYRWRGGKAEQFIALSKDKNPFNNPDKKLIHLERNYRSHSQVIEFNNAFFRLLSDEFENEDYKDLYANHSKQEYNDKMGGYVNISFIPKTENGEQEEEAKNKTELYLLATLNTIRKVKNLGFDLKDIAILTRKRAQGIAVANYLTEQGIALLSSETLMIQNATEVRLIINVLKYLKNSADLEAKANFLQYVAEFIQDRLPMHDFIAKGMEERDETAFENWLMDFTFQDSEPVSFKDIRKKSLYESVEIIISKFIKPERNNAYVQYFLDIVLERDVRNQAGISDFLNFWDKNAEKFSIPSPQGEDAVRIMTIHTSKGLEFPVVIMPFAEEDYSRKPKDKLWLDAEESAMGLPKALIDNSSAIEGYGDEAAFVFNQKKQEELLDNINVLYVALTRAEEQLYVISGMNLTSRGEVKPNDMSTFFINYLIAQQVFDINKMEYEFGNAKKISVPNEKPQEAETISPVSKILNPKNIKIAQRESMMWGTSQQQSIEYGNLIHEILSLIKTKKDISLAITKSLADGLITVDQEELIYNSIFEIVNHKALECFFDPEHEVLNEQIIIQKTENIIKPDRMVFTKGKEVFLLDYKTGAQMPKHLAQLNNYQTAIERMGYKVTKKVLVYIGEQINIVNL